MYNGIGSAQKPSSIDWAWKKGSQNIAQLNFELRFQKNGGVLSCKMLTWYWKELFPNDYVRRDGRKCYKVNMQKLCYINIWHDKGTWFPTTFIWHQEIYVRKPNVLFCAQSCVGGFV